MMRDPTRHFGRFRSGPLFATLIAGLLLVGGSTVRAAEEASPLPDYRDPALTEEARLPPLEAFTAMVDRPLFVASRRPHQPAPEVVAAPVREAVAPAPIAPPTSFRFVGTVARPGAPPYGLVSLEGEDELIRVGAGDRLEEWTVVSIAADELIVRRADEERQYRLLR